MEDEPEGAEIIYCTYGQCADAEVPCPRCTRIVIGEDDGMETARGTAKESK